MPDSNSTATSETLRHIRLCCQTLIDRKASEIQVLDVSGKSTITDYLILATGMSEPHLKALRADLEKTCKEHNITMIGTDRETISGWLVFDAFDLMVHLFTEEQREFYRLETLWKDAISIDWETL